MKTLIFAGLAGLTLGACTRPGDGPNPPGFTQMTGSEIRSTLVGNSLRGTDRTGSYVIHYRSASKMDITYNDRPDTGLWRIKGDRYCRRWTRLGKGKERCVTMYQRGDQINWVKDGEITDRSVLLAGNPAGL